MQQRDFIDIELFPCAGGMAKGFKDAGVHFDLAVELLENHCDSYEQNIGHRPVQMDVRSLYEMLLMGWRPPKRVRLLVADPPCTPWSRAGKRLGTDDPRDMLEGTCKVIALLQPDVYLIGNVPGLDDGPNLPIVQKHIGSLSKFGYCTADFARLNAANYGVPQHRHRPFWFGHKAGPCIMWPRPTHGDPDTVNANLTLPGVDELKPWVTCRQALGHLTMEELGRPIKLRKRMQNSKQHGSVAERPARVVGTSNLSDGNVLLNDDQPRAGKKGKKHGTPQGERLTHPDKTSPTITATHGRHTVIDREALEEDWNECGPMYDYTKPLELQEGVPQPKKKTDKRPPETKAQGKRIGNIDKPSATVTAKPSRKGAGAHAVFTLQPNRGQTLSTMDTPAPAIVRNTHGNGSILVINDKHRPVSPDEPAGTIRGGGEGHSAPPVVIQMEPHHPPSRIDEPAMTVRAGSGGGANRCLEMTTNAKHPTSDMDKPATTQGAKPRQGSVIKTSSNHPASSHDAPSNTIRASDGEGSNRALSWPWDRPSTTVCADERLSPPGHHDEEWTVLSVDGDGVVISERAAAILQGFPETWVFVGKSKKKRWSQIGQAMPPPLAYAVGTSVVEQIAKTPADEIAAARNKQRLADVPMLTVLRGGE